MTRPAPLTAALLFTALLALTSLTVRGWLLPRLNDSDVAIVAVLGVEMLVLGVLLLGVALMALTPRRSVYRWLKGLYVFAIVDASLWLIGGIGLWIALALDTGSIGGHGTADGLATLLLVVLTAPRMAWSVVKIIVVVVLYRLVTRHAPPWLDAVGAR